MKDFYTLLPNDSDETELSEFYRIFSNFTQHIGNVSQQPDSTSFIGDEYFQLEEGNIQLEESNVQLEEGNIQLEGNVQLSDNIFHLTDNLFELSSDSAQSITNTTEKSEFVIIKEPAENTSKKSNGKIMPYRKLLSEGELLNKVSLEGNQVTFHLKEEYNTNEHKDPINHMLYYWFKTSPNFSLQFEQPRRGTHSPYLILHEGHSITDAQSVLKTLQELTKNKAVPYKKILADGDLISSVSLNGNQVTINLNEKYNSNTHYRLINKLLYNMFTRSSAFSKQFKQPVAGNHSPFLILENDHNFNSGEAVLNELLKLSKRGHSKTKIITSEVLPSAEGKIQRTNAKPLSVSNENDRAKSVQKTLITGYQLKMDQLKITQFDVKNKPSQENIRLSNLKVSN